MHSASPVRRRLPAVASIALAACAALAGCRGTPDPPPLAPGRPFAPAPATRPPAPAKAPELLAPVAPEARDGDEIAVCGKLFDTGAPVVLWHDRGGYNGYATGPVLTQQGPTGLRYHPGREVSDPLRRSDLAELREVVDQFVLHYDACGTSRVCFRVLHDERKLSVHFLLDLDGTIYQTLDLKEQAWHARQANPRSIGVEIANVGAYPPNDSTRLREFYTSGPGGTRITLPERFGDGGLRTPGFRGRPARPAPVRGVINGVELEMYDFTPQQYDSLVKLTATLIQVLPRIELAVPSDGSGGVAADALDDESFARFRGILGHWHVTEGKADPGPAFDWESYLQRLRAELARRTRRTPSV